MKRYISFILLIVLFTTLYGCGEKLNGHSEKDYELSRKKVESKLSKDEKVKLEKALRVIAGECLRLNLDEPENYKNQPYKNVVLKMVDGCTYASVVTKAEDILKGYNEREAAKLEHEIDSLEKKKAADVNITKRMSSLFKVESMNITRVNFFNDSIPSLHISYTYTGNHPLQGEVGVSYEIYEKGATAPVVGIISIYGDSNSTLQPGEAIEENLLLKELAKKDPQKWNAVKYPLHNLNLQSLGLRLDVHPVSFVLNGTHYAIPKTDDAALTADIKGKKAEVNDIKKSKGTLNELELSDDK
jgi:hypothetical protein